MDRPEFCSAFDEHLALAGPPAIFIRTLEEQWRVEPDLSRDGYERARLRGEPVPPLSPAVHVLARDTRTGFVSRFLVTAPALFADHPRLEVRFFEEETEAEAVLDSLGRPPLCAESWASTPEKQDG